MRKGRVGIALRQRRASRAATPGLHADAGGAEGARVAVVALQPLAGAALGLVDSGRIVGEKAKGAEAPTSTDVSIATVIVGVARDEHVSVTVSSCATADHVLLIVHAIWGPSDRTGSSPC